MARPTVLPPDRYRGRSPLPTWVRVLIVLLTIFLVGTLAAFGLLFWAFSGGWDGIRPHAHSGSRRVVKARERSGAELDALAQQALTLVGPGRELARIRS